MVDLDAYKFKGLIIGKITPKESFMDTNTEKIYE